jgi:hypothetical protein
MPNPTEKEKPKKKGFMQILNSTFGDDGLKTDIKITITNETCLKIIATAVAVCCRSTCN